MLLTFHTTVRPTASPGVNREFELIRPQHEEASEVQNLVPALVIGIFRKPVCQPFITTILKFGPVLLEPTAGAGVALALSDAN